MATKNNTLTYIPSHIAEKVGKIAGAILGPYNTPAVQKAAVQEAAVQEAALKEAALKEAAPIRFSPTPKPGPPNEQTGFPPSSLFDVRKYRERISNEGHPK